MNLKGPRSVHMIKGIKENVLFLIPCLAALLFVGILSGCGSGSKKRVLVVHSYEKGYAAYPFFDRSIAEEFKREGVQADIRTLYLDCESYNEIPELRRMRKLLDSLGEWKPDIILVNDDQAHYSLLKCGHPLVKEVPIVFSGVNFPNWDLIRGFSNVTGFYDKMDILANIRAIEELIEGKAVVYTYVDSTYLDKQIRRMISAQLAGSGIPVADGDEVPPVEQLADNILFERDSAGKRIQSLFRYYSLRNNRNAGKILWNISKYADYTYYLQTKRDFVIENIANITSSMSFSAINEAVGYKEGLLGGYFSSIPILVKEQVGAAVRILNGEKPENIPITESAKEYVMDWQLMKHWNIRRGDISDKYRIINMPFYDRYKWQANLFFVLVVLGIAYLFFLIYTMYRKERYKKRKVMEDLRKEKDMLARNVQMLRDREKELIEARMLAEKAELKESFLANMSHEIRTPLNAIVGFSNILASAETEDYTSKERKEFIDIINLNSEQLLKLINDILEISRIESGNMSFTFEKCDLETLIDEVYLTHRVLIKEPVRFIREKPENISLVLNVDKRRLVQVLTNLLNNAAKFTTSGYIKLGYRPLDKNRKVCIYVEDTGKGIPPEEQKIIFDRFYKRDEFMQGAGLGLSICHLIVEKLNGRIELESRPGKGCRFSVILPCVDKYPENG